MKYKVGDKVRIKSLDWYKTAAFEGRVICDGLAFLEMMTEFCGKELTIDCIFTDERGSGYIMKEPKIQWRFTDSMIECPVDAELKETMVSLDKVCDLLYAMLTTQDINDYYYVTAPAYDNVVDFVEDFRKSFKE